MPGMSAAKRASGAWVADGSLAPETPLANRETKCGFWEGDAECVARTERRFLVGPRCARHTPAAVAGRPEPNPDPALSVDGLRDRKLTAADPARYGRATTDPLGREGPGWHTGKQSGLPTKNKGDSK